jgi:thiamine phosphate synthase YjbQ (UPF0047 family)
MPERSSSKLPDNNVIAHSFLIPPANPATRHLRVLSENTKRASSPTSNPIPSHHKRTGEDNGRRPFKCQIIGREVVVAITSGKLDLGRWEQIFYGEFDGNRPKRVLVKIIGE